MAIPQIVYTWERKINNSLFTICFVVTIITFVTMLLRFFTRGAYPPNGLDFFYIGVLLIYSLHKETIRWIIEKEGGMKRGEYFVYAWLILVTGLYLINFFTKGYFEISSTGQELHTLREASLTALEVGGVFVFSRIMKIIRVYFLKKERA